MKFLKSVQLLCFLCLVIAFAATEALSIEPSNKVPSTVSGSYLLLEYRDQTTSGTPVELPLKTRNVNKLFIDYVSDKGATVSIVRLPKDGDDTLLGYAYNTTGLTLPDGGGAKHIIIDPLGARAVKITITPVQAGTSTTSYFSVSGSGN